MKVSELIRRLSFVDPNAQVFIYEPAPEGYEEALYEIFVSDPPNFAVPGGVSLQKDYFEVNLIASGYEWTCPICNTLNKIIEYEDRPICGTCNHEVRVREAHHARE